MAFNVTNYYGENAAMRRLMIEQGYSLETLADACGVTKKTVWRVLNGKSFSRVDTVLIICHTLGCTLDTLYPIDIIE